MSINVGIEGLFIGDVLPGNQYELPPQVLDKFQQDEIVLSHDLQSNHLNVYPDFAWAELHSYLKRMAKKDLHFAAIHNSFVRHSSHTILHEDGSFDVPFDEFDPGGHPHVVFFGMGDHLQMWSMDDYHKDRKAWVPPSSYPNRHVRILESQLVVPDSVKKIVIVTNDILNEPERIRSLNSRQFEEFTAELLQKLGYSVTVTQATVDGGKDIIAARHDLMGDFLYLVECKAYSPKRRVGVEVIRALHGVVEKERATSGMVVTTSMFSKAAQAYQKDIRHRMALADYNTLASWLDTIRKKH